MEFIRQIVNSSVLEPVFPLPASLRNAQVEVIILPVPDTDVSPKREKQSAFGRLRAYGNPAIIPEEKGAWEKSVSEKYDVYLC